MQYNQLRRWNYRNRKKNKRKLEDEMGKKKLPQNINNLLMDIGNQLVSCKANCLGTQEVDIKNGIIPRCLILEFNERTNPMGTVIVGINPGKSKLHEQEYYKRNFCSYQSVIDYYFEEGLKDHKYYVYLRDFVNCLGRLGPILWTELVKCENKQRNTKPPLQTFRYCTNKFLNREIKAVPDSWLLVAAGKEAYKALVYIYPQRPLIGIPHPTSSRGYFHKLFINKRRNEFKEKDFNNNKSVNKAIWLYSSE
jgi:hypothetical protein